MSGEEGSVERGRNFALVTGWTVEKFSNRKQISNKICCAA